MDAKGNAYVTGYRNTNCIPGEPCDPKRSIDAWVIKIDASTTGSFEVGTGTSIGGSGDDWPAAIAVDGSGNAYITGYTQSTDFPAVNALQRHRSGSMDAFVTKINANGNGLAYSTYLGGRSDDLGLGIAVAPNGNAYVVGQHELDGFDKNSIAYDRPFAELTNAFVTKIASRTFVSVGPPTLGSVNRWSVLKARRRK